jgi:hypothetical protein
MLALLVMQTLLAMPIVRLLRTALRLIDSPAQLLLIHANLALLALVESLVHPILHAQRHVLAPLIVHLFTERHAQLLLRHVVNA